MADDTDIPTTPGATGTPQAPAPGRVTAGDPTVAWVSRIDLAQVLDAVARATRGRYPWVSSHDVEDAATEAIARLVFETSRGHTVVDGDPTGYLITVARRVVVDRARSPATRRTSLFAAGDEHDLPVREDDEIAAFVDRDAAAADVRRALAATRAAGDATAYRVVTFVLDEIAATGTMPSHRDTGTRLGLSHTGVAKALTRFRTHLAHTR